MKKSKKDKSKYIIKIQFTHDNPYYWVDGDEGAYEEIYKDAFITESQLKRAVRRALKYACDLNANPDYDYHAEGAVLTVQKITDVEYYEVA